MTTTMLSRQRLQQLAEEATALADWTVVRDFALQMYGDKAVKIVIDTYGSSDDEGGMDYSIESIAAYDKDGKELRFDHSLPFFASSTWGEDETEDDDDDEDDDEEEEEDDDDDEDKEEDLSKFKEIWRVSDEDEKCGWILLEDLPVDEHNGGCETYDLTTIPSISLPVTQ